MRSVAPNRPGIGVLDCPACCRPLVMGVINVTPDSFSDGGRFADPAAAIAHGRALLADGRRLARRGRRVHPPGRRARARGRGAAPGGPRRGGPGRRRAPASRSTPARPAVARAAVAAGATLLNDVGAAHGALAAELGVAWAAHARPGRARHHAGRPPLPTTSSPRSATSSSPEADAAVAAGVPEVWIDPGHRLRQDARSTTWRCWPTSTRFVATGYPVLVGTSRKGFLGRAARRAPTAPTGPRPSTTASKARSPPPPGPWPAARAWCAPTTSAPPRTPRCVIGGHITKDAA